MELEEEGCLIVGIERFRTRASGYCIPLSLGPPAPTFARNLSDPAFGNAARACEGQVRNSAESLSRFETNLKNGSQ